MKKHLSLFMMLLLVVMSIIPVNAIGEEQEQALAPVILYQKGDLNADGLITAEDARLCLRATVGLEELNDLQRAAADLSGSGVIDSSCARSILRGRKIPNPGFDIDTLLGCEQQYKAWDINHQLKMRIGIQDDSFGQREEICRRINELMAADKKEYIRKCRQCGRELPPGYTFNLCEACYSDKSYIGTYRFRR